MRKLLHSLYRSKKVTKTEEKIFMDTERSKTNEPH